MSPAESTSFPEDNEQFPRSGSMTWIHLRFPYTVVGQPSGPNHLLRARLSESCPSGAPLGSGHREPKPLPFCSLCREGMEASLGSTASLPHWLHVSPARTAQEFLLPPGSRGHRLNPSAAFLEPWFEDAAPAVSGVSLCGQPFCCPLTS